MLITAQVREEYKKQLPAITHVDGSARVQTVNKDDNPLYWQAHK
jgi:carbamoyltransferase